MLDFQLKISARARGISIRLNHQGEILVTAPRFTPKFLIKQVVAHHQDWIERQLQKQQKVAYETAEQISLFGQEYQKTLISDSQLPWGISIKQKKLIINILDPKPAKKRVDAMITRFLKTTATKYILPRTEQLGKKMALKFQKITLREQTSRWGSCSSKKNLNFNWRLVHFKPEIIDYVIIHELAHLEHLNHSAKFWQLVKQYDPAYPSHRGFLKKQSV